MIKKREFQPTIVAIGSELFGHQVQSYLASNRPGVNMIIATTNEAWTKVLENHPDILVVEIGLGYNKTTHSWMRSFLTQVRERFSNNICIILALLAPERLFFAGDLLFANPTQLTPSNFVDSFVTNSPVNLPGQSSLVKQILQRIDLWSYELERREEHGVFAPTLGSTGWVQSMADPASCDLWLRWLPRYAIYNNENPIIIGETGTGKTNLAYALHYFSDRKGNFVSMTPRDFSSSELVQAELFGAVAGAYTGAVDKWGLVKSAEGGTLFIDELQSIDKDLQGKLITFIESKAYRRVGSAESISADVRFVFASNKSIPEMIRAEILREDFAYRLERVQLELKPLRLRRLDIPAALAFALAKIDRQRPHAVTIEGFSNSAYRILFSSSWPGNLRQLENKVAQLCEVADMQKCKCIDHNMFNAGLHGEVLSDNTTTNDIFALAAMRFFQQALQCDSANNKEGIADFIDTVRSTALESCSGDIEQAAQMIDDDKETLHLFLQGWTAKEELQTFK